MAWNPVTLIQTQGTNGDTSQPAVDMDTVDSAAIVVPGLIAYQRARLLGSAPNTAFVDDCLNPVTVGGTTKTYSATGINGRPTINLDGTGAPPYEVAVQMPASFTWLGVFKPAAVPGGGYPNLFTTSKGDFQVGTASGGALAVDIDGSGPVTYHNSTDTLVANVPILLAVSVDGSNKTIRLMKGGPVADYLVTDTAGFPATAGSYPHPFGAYATGSDARHLNGAWSLSALFNVAYGFGGDAEAPWAALIAACKAHWAV
jgi:hypothetical protein